MGKKNKFPTDTLGSYGEEFALDSSAFVQAALFNYAGANADDGSGTRIILRTSSTTIANGGAGGGGSNGWWVVLTPEEVVDLIKHLMHLRAVAMANRGQGS